MFSLVRWSSGNRLLGKGQDYLMLQMCRRSDHTTTDFRKGEIVLCVLQRGIRWAMLGVELLGCKLKSYK